MWYRQAASNGHNDLLAFFPETTLENEEFKQEVSPIEVGLFKLFHDKYDYANEVEEAILKPRGNHHGSFC